MPAKEPTITLTFFLGDLIYDVKCVSVEEAHSILDQIRRYVTESNVAMFQTDHNAGLVNLTELKFCRLTVVN